MFNSRTKTHPAEIARKMGGVFNFSVHTYSLRLFHEKNPMLKHGALLTVLKQKIMNNEQIEITDKLLKILTANGGTIDTDKITSNFLTNPDKALEQSKLWGRIKHVISLLKEYQIAEWITPKEDFLTIKVNGMRAEKIGMAKYIKELEEKENIESFHNSGIITLGNVENSNQSVGSSSVFSQSRNAGMTNKNTKLRNASIIIGIILALATMCYYAWYIWIRKE